MLYTGLTYCGHPLACAAGVAALAAYEDEGLIARSRAMGPGLLAELERLKARHPVIGDVRGGRGLFAVVELVADRATREPLAPWPQQPPQLKALAEAALAEGGRWRRVAIDHRRAAAGDQGNRAGRCAVVLDRLLSRFFPTAE